MIRVMIADDQELFRHSMQIILSRQPDIEVVAAAKDGEEAVELARRFHPDVALLDIRMPKMDGVQCTELIKRHSPETKIVILTTFDDDEYVFGALCNGAIGYLLKGISLLDFIQAIRDAAAGGSIISPDVTKTVVQMFARLARGSMSVRVTDRMTEDLLPNEWDIIREIGQGQSNREIAATLHFSEGTVRNYVSSILNKLQLRDRTQLAIWAVQTGVVEGLI